MRKSIFAKILVAGIAVSAASVAGAQTNGPIGLSARIGVFLPTDKFAHDLSANWFAVGADYKFRDLPMSSVAMGTVSYLGLSVDYYSHGDTSALPIVANYNIRSGQFVYSAGIGVDFVRIGANTSGLCGQLAAAYEFGNIPTPVFVQAKYFMSSKSQLNGFGLFAGIRF